MNKIKICIFSLLAVALFSCSEDYENFNSKVYINGDAQTTTYLIKPNVSEFMAALNVGIPKPATHDIEVSFKIDENLVAVYNKTFGREAVILPSEHYTMSENKVAISTGAVRSADIDIKFVNTNLLDREIFYVLPVTIANADIEVLESARTRYFVFMGGALINWAADIEQNYFPVSWGNSSLVSGLTRLTIESLLYLRTAEREGSDSQIMTFFGVENGFLIRLGDTFAPGQVMVVVGTGKYPTKANDRVKVPVGEWFHLAVTFEADGALKIYINGELTSTTAVGSSSINLASKCYVGYSYNSNRWWPGLICETRVWNVVRTQKEIVSNSYDVDANTPGLIAYWKFDEGNGKTITDRSENGNSITAAGDLKWMSVSLPE